MTIVNLNRKKNQLNWFDFISIQSDRTTRQPSLYTTLHKKDGVPSRSLERIVNQELEGPSSLGELRRGSLRFTLHFIRKMACRAVAWNEL